MKNKFKLVIIGVIVVVIAALAGGIYMNDKKAQEEKQLLKDERIAAKQIKNSFADIKRIEFDKNSVRKHTIPGDTGVLVYVITKNNKFDLLISLPTDSESVTLPSFIGSGGEKGKTGGKVKVIYTNAKEEVIE